MTPRLTIKFYILKTIMFGSFFILSGCTTFNPATNRNELILISSSQEISIGAQAHKEFSAKYKIITGTEEARRLEAIGQKLAHVSSRKDLDYHFYLIDSEDINAFTVPGGYIYFYTGLFRKLTDDQIASVLAHELGHCAAKHTVKKFQAALGYSWISSVTGQVLAAKAPIVEQIVSMGANAIAQLAMSAYGRQDEFEADHLGITYLHLAGVNLNAMIQTFEILEHNTKKDVTPLILRTHPYIKDRIEAVQREIQNIQGNR